MKMPKIKIFVLIVVMLTFFSLVGVGKVNAQNPFGGFITASFFCPCSGNFLLTVAGQLGGQFVYQPGTPQFANHQLPRSGVWVLGLYSFGGACMVPSGSGCNPVGIPIGTITPIVGTSM